MARMLVLFLLLTGVAWGAPENPGPTGMAGQAPGQALVLKGATVHPATGPALSDATLVVRNGRIAALGRDVPPPAGAVVVDLKGMHVYPSLIDADTTLGLVEVGSVRATRDINEVGSVNPNARADEAFNPDSQLLPVAMSSGILVAGVAPRGGLVSGRSAVMLLDGWTREDMALLAPGGLMVRWPRMAIDRSPGEDADEQEQKREQQLRRLREVFENARAYQRARKANGPQERDVKWEAMIDVVEGRAPVFVEAGGFDEIAAALDFLEAMKLKGVIVGGAEAWRLADRIARAKVPVIYNEIVAVPHADHVAYDAYYTAPAVLSRAGVTVALSCGGEAAHVRNLSDFAGRAAAYGMDALAALRSITLVPARVLGVADRLGSLEVGKDATLFVTDGDILDTRTHVVRAWVQGRELDLQDRQKALYEKYRARPRAAERPGGVGDGK